MPRKKILIAAGGTGGHLFPAQALAEQLLEKGYPPIFAGAGLKTSPFFDSGKFHFYDVSSITPFGGKKRLLAAPWVLSRGVLQSLKILKKERISLVIGFGSFHSFPLLCAAWLKRVPIVLFEPNAHLGKVNRLFSKRARLTAIQFSEGMGKTQGTLHIVSALMRKMDRVTRKQAADYFSLDENKSTLLIFGGSQGALTINEYIFKIAPELAKFKEKWQILHLIGHNTDAETFRKLYGELHMTACVKPFEEKMAYAWSLARLVISRSGASTIAEQVFFGVPAIFIPFPFGNDDHQKKNALVIAHQGGAEVVEQGEGGEERLLAILRRLIEGGNGELEKMSCALESVKETQNQQQLSSFILQMIDDGKE